MDVGSEINEGQGLIVLCGGQIVPEYFMESHFGLQGTKTQLERESIQPFDLQTRMVPLPGLFNRPLNPFPSCCECWQLSAWNSRELPSAEGSGFGDINSFMVHRQWLTDSRVHLGRWLRGMCGFCSRAFHCGSGQSKMRQALLGSSTFPCLLNFLAYRFFLPR